MRVAIEFTFAPMPMDARSGRALRDPDNSTFLAQVDQVLAALDAALRQDTRRPVEFSQPAPPVGTTEYIQALSNHAARLNVMVARDVGGILLALRAGAPTLNEQNHAEPACEARFSFTESSICVPCGRRCHMVDGQADVQCPGGTPTALVWRPRTDSGEVLTYQIHVNYRFLAPEVP